jgi:hypothetical protein
MTPYYEGIEHAKEGNPDWMNPYSDIENPSGKQFFIDWYAGWCFQTRKQFFEAKEKQDKAEYKQYLKSSYGR